MSETETAAPAASTEQVDRAALAKQVTLDIVKHIAPDATVDLSEEEGRIFLRIDCAEPGLIIGRKGSTLDALQFLVHRIVDRTAKGARITIEAGGYRESHEEQIIELAREAAEAAKKQRRPQAIENLTSAERRIVHTILQNDPGVKTESRGEGEDRILIISPVTT